MSRRKDKGIALMLAIVMVSMVSILLTCYVAATISERNRAKHELALGSAEYMARAALEKTFIDLSCEYELDKSWIDDNTINFTVINDLNGDGIVDSGEGMPNPGDNSDLKRSDYKKLYSNVSFPDSTSPTGTYSVDIAFVKLNSSTFSPNSIWVKATGNFIENGAILDSITLTQFARVKTVALVEIDPLTGAFVKIERLYNSLDQPGDSAVDNAMAATNDHEIRISGEDLDEDVTIVPGSILTIKGGYGYDFSDASRDTYNNISKLKDTAADPAVTISGTGTVIMGGVRIE